MKYFRRGNVFNIGFHLIFVTKRRAPVLHKVENIVKNSFRYSAIKNNFIICDLEIMPDHIHLFIKCKTTTANIPRIVQSLKGVSSFRIRKSYINRKKILHIWSPSYFVESIGNMSENIIRKYIQRQKINVKPNYEYKSLVSNNSKLHKHQTDIDDIIPYILKNRYILKNQYGIGKEKVCKTVCPKQYSPSKK
jgi:putative transposase